MVYNIYVVGNINTFFSVFTGLQMLFNPLNNTAWASGQGWGGPLIGLGLVASLVGLVVASLINSRFLMHHVIIMAVAYAVLFGVTEKVNITNVYNGQSQIIPGIPVGIALPASTISDLFYTFAQKLGEANQQVGTNDTYMFSSSNPNTVYGFDGPLALIYNLRGIYSTFSMTDPRLSESIASYVGQCYAPFNIDMSQMAKSGNLADLLFNNAPPDPHLPVTLYTNGGDQTVKSYATTCGQAQPILQQAWNNFQGGQVPQEFENFQNLLTKQMSNSTVPSVTPAEANSLIGSVLEGSANSGFDFMNNMILNCAVQVGADHFYNLYSSNNSAPMSSYCSTKASAFGRAVTLNAASASLFNMNMVPMMAVLQFLFFAGAPIIAFVMILMGPAGLSKYISYIVFGFSTMMWIPVSQIISDYSEDQMRHSMHQMMASMNGDPITAPENIPIILEHAMRNVAMADKMLALTPVVTLALLGLGGAYALTRLAQDNSSESSASEAIGEAAPMPANDSLENSIAERQVNSTGVAAFSGAGFAAGESLPAWANMSINGSSSMSTAAQAAEQSAISLNQQAMTARMEEARNVASVLTSREAAQSSFFKQDSSASLQFDAARKSLSQLSASTGLDETQAAAFAAALRAELGPKGISGKLSKMQVFKALRAAGLSASAAAADEGKVTDAMNNKSVQEAANSVSSGTTATLAQKVASGTQDTDMQKTAASINRSGTRAASLTRQAAAARQQAQSLSKMATTMQNTSAGVSWDTGSMLSAMASYDENRSSNQPDAVLASEAAAGNAGLYKMWDSNYRKAKATGMNDNAAAAVANVRTFNQAMLGSPAKAGEFLNNVLHEFGGFATPPANGAQVQAEQRAVAQNTNPGGNGTAIRQANALFGAADRGTGWTSGGGGVPDANAAAAEDHQNRVNEAGAYDGINPYGADNQGAVKAQGAAWIKSTDGAAPGQAPVDQPTAPAGYTKTAAHVRKVTGESWPLQFANAMQNNPQLTQKIGAGAVALQSLLGAGSSLLGGGKVPTAPDEGGGEAPKVKPNVNAAKRAIDPQSESPSLSERMGMRPASSSQPTTEPGGSTGINPENVSPMQAAEGEIQGLIDGSPAAEAAAGDIATGVVEGAVDSGG
ncbi:MAG: conjugal transfer protein TraG N-terminal domain-containing protein [Acidithiobacillus sp.]|nr:conjugal transfer protein TraG N-terminal domain-containing protein [Acidithiobacillus sp.]